MFDTGLDGLNSATLEGLNDEQRTAVTHDGGPLLVLAGAGTGKTTTLCSRVGWLVEQGVAPDRVLLLTFTRRAAREMLARTRALLGSNVPGTVVGGTFHSTAHQLIRVYAAAARQICVAPRMNNPTPDLITAWSQPEAATLWAKWWHPSIGDAYAPAYEGTKAVIVTLGGLKRGPHVLAGHDALTASPQLLDFFSELANAAGRAPSGKPPLVVREYSATTRHLKLLSEGFPELAQETCVHILEALADLYPNAPIGRYITIDGTAVPAWCPQQSAKRNGILDDQIEARYRKNVPEAAFRAIGYDADGQFDPDAETGRKAARHGKFWRGYRLVVATDLATGIPLVGTLFGADTHEPHSAETMLDRLYDAWPDIPLTAVVADKLWDDNRTHRLLETNYGVHLVADRQPSHIERGGKVFAPLDKYQGGIAKISGDGIGFCRTCGGPLRFERLDPPPRTGHSPGEPTTARFRARFACERCGRRPGVPADLAWSALPHYPLNPLGRPDLYADRIALLAQRNIAESVFSSLKGAFAQGLSGGRRTRVFDRGVYESVIWTALVTRALLTLADQRQAQLALTDLAA